MLRNVQVHAHGLPDNSLFSALALCRQRWLAKKFSSLCDIYSHHSLYSLPIEHSRSHKQCLLHGDRDCPV